MIDTITWKSFAAESGIEPISELNQSNWPAWLTSSQDSLAGRAEVFPEGQLCLVSELGLLATLSSNRINWDGTIQALPTWDEVAGSPSTFEHTFIPDGNTVCLMSTNVSPAGKGQQLPKRLFGAIVDYGRAEGVDHIIGPFRPSAYGRTVLAAAERGDEPPSFGAYCATVNEHDEPLDPWLRSVSRNGMRPLAVEPAAMIVPVTSEQFNTFRQPEWRMVTINGQEAWSCAQTGFFYPQPDGNFLYKESNLWGTIYNIADTVK
jgi:GNAT superfamily N-acetyltransferase